MTIKTVIRVLLTLCLFPSFSNPSSAQCADSADTCSPGVPRLVRFRGAMKDSSGKPLTGIVGVTFAIYSEPTSGTPLWQETQNVQLDQQGQYAVLLGATANGGLPKELFSSGEPRWLGVQAQVPGESPRPRVMLVSVPYALESANAQTLGGLPPSAFLRAPASEPNGTATAPLARTIVSAAVGSDLPSSSSQSVDAAAGGSQIGSSRALISRTAPPNILYADQYAGGVPEAIRVCPSPGCVIYAYSRNANRNLGTIDPGSKAITLYLGPFTYNVSQITLQRELKIIGMGSGITFLQSVGGNKPVIVVPQAVNGVAVNVSLSGFRLIGSVGNSSQDGILWDSSGFANSGVWYSEINDLFITGFAGNGIHLVGANSNYSGMSQFVEFNRVIVFRPRGGGNGLRIEGAAYELYFNDCQIDGAAPGDGTNIFIGARPGSAYAVPTDINFRGLTMQSAAVGVQIEGGWALSFYSPHHEGVWGVYSVSADLGAALAGLTISDAGFQTSGSNNGGGYLLKVTTPAAYGIRFIHNHIMSPPDAVILATNGASIVYRDNLFFGTTNLPATTGITVQLAPSPSINIGGTHTVGLTSSTTPITTILSGLGPGEMVTFLTINGPVTFGSGGNINLMGSSALTVNGSITFVVSDLAGTPSLIPVSQWTAGVAQ
jgi:hypothetical protein